MLIASLRRVPRGVVVLGFVSLLMDASSELVHALLPLFMVSVLGASTLAVGIIEGLAEGTAMIARVVSGYISDASRRRKPLVLLGYGLGALSKLAFPFDQAQNSGQLWKRTPNLANQSLPPPKRSPPLAKSSTRSVTSV